jgi:hypothetical protein
MRDAILTSGDVVSTVRELTDIGPRPPGTANDARARERIAAALRSAGLDSVWSEPVEAPRWIRGLERAEILGASAQTMAVHQLGLSVPTANSGVTAPIVRFTDAAAVAGADPALLRNRIVFIDHVMPRGRDGSGFGIVGARRGDAVAQAGRAGAVAVIVRAPGTGKHALPHAVNIGYQPGVPKVPVASLSNAHSDSLAALIARGETPRVKLVLTGRDSAMTTSANVLGEIRGSEFPNEIVLLAAHHDSWDVGTGALDDAAGTAIVIEAARKIASMGRPRRTVRFVLFAAEELGLRGARAYVSSHSSDRHVLALEPDQGAGRAYRLRAPADQLPAGLLNEMEAVLVPMGVQRVRERSIAGPDLIPLRERGVFTLDVAHDMTDFWDYAHSALDVFERIQPESLRATAAAYASVVYLAAHWPTALPTPPQTTDR